MSEQIPEDILKSLRTHEVLADMDQKYGITRSTPQPVAQATSDGDPMGTQRWFQHFTEQRNAFLATLEGLPIEKFSIPTEELEQIKAAVNSVRSFVEKYKRERAIIKKEDYSAYDKKKREELLAELDRMNMWCAKFATQCSGGAGPDVPLQRYNEDEDSLYYMTPAGVTMRIKTIELVNGLHQAVQPFTEKILFVGPNGEISEVPQEGYTVEEHLTESFSKVVAGNKAGEYQSGLDIYRRGSEVAAIAHKNELGHISFSPAHTGDRVNKIFFLK